MASHFWLRTGVGRVEHADLGKVAIHTGTGFLVTGARDTVEGGSGGPQCERRSDYLARAASC